ncbi:outer membrane protein [Bradyrhizobium sp. DOA9]|uniref:outer membrane protein n=1 Tax=Bradyrhizobium sp. DOA9 TaxID=1126627 RepID=UPI00072318B1|nr:outer membrane beta-barrel protein [Bradyrhizobium sp. DOA9]GAJ34185.1 31 kDa outer-membrane immunogenic protein precursor [Bradyrhizobium sp. DOA9]
MIKAIAAGISGLSLLVSVPVGAADLVAKAPIAAPPTWTGFYVGGQIGGAWANRDVTYAANDGAAAAVVSGGFVFAGTQPISPNSFNMSGVVGGIDAGYNWQIQRGWLLGIEADLNGSGLKGSGSSTSFIQQLPGLTFTQTVAEQQKVEWYGTLRGRIGWLPRADVLLFATGGLAYGKVTSSGDYSTNGPFAAPFGAAVGGVSLQCTTNSTCFAGSSSSIRTGWTAGAGGEWMFSRNWTAKLEYQYVNLGGDGLRLTANAVVSAADTPASFNANSARVDFHVVRAGVNFHF